MKLFVMSVLDNTYIGKYLVARTLAHILLLSRRISVYVNFLWWMFSGYIMQTTTMAKQS